MLTNLAFWRANARHRRAVEAEPVVRDERLRAVGFSRAYLVLALMRGIR